MKKDQEIQGFIISNYYSKLEMSELQHLKSIVEKLNAIVLNDGITEEV